MNKVKVYDVEVFKNYISFTFIDFEDYLVIRKRIDNEKIPINEAIPLLESVPKEVFEISAVEGHEINDLGRLMSYTSQGDFLAGFNSIGYDNLILNFLSMNSGRYKDISKLIYKTYELSKYIVESESEILYKDENIKLLKRFNGNYYSIDVQRIVALEKILKSLKQTLINLKWYNIIDYEMPPISDLDQHYYKEWEADVINQWDRYIVKEYIEELNIYNFNDTLGTCEMFYFLLEDIKLRFEISEQYNINVLSSSNAKISDAFFRKYYTEAARITVTEFLKGRTYRQHIKLENCIHGSVRFRTEPFKKMLANVRNTVVENTRDFNIKFTHDGVTYNIKSGGLHSVDYPEVFKSTDDILIRDADVSSYYPSLIMNGEICPKHLNKNIFLKVYKTIVAERLEAKYNKEVTKAAVLKITANGVYGKFNFEYGPLLDAKCTLQVTITGQLQLLMLIERLTMNNFKVISSNTDGIVAIVPKDREEEYYSICKEWEIDTKLSLEYTDYPLYVRRDVNNYFTVKNMSDPYNNIKAKGDLDEFLRIAEPKLNKGFNMPIIAHAIQRYFIEDRPVADTIRCHKDIFDFCTTTNIGIKFKLELHSIRDGQFNIEKVQKNTRYYVSHSGGTLYKAERYGSKLSHMCKGNYVTVFNKYVYHKDMLNYDINYNYYIHACNKIINRIKTGVRPGAKSNKRIRERLDQGTLF